MNIHEYIEVLKAGLDSNSTTIERVLCSYTWDLLDAEPNETMRNDALAQLYVISLKLGKEREYWRAKAEWDCLQPVSLAAVWGEAAPAPPDEIIDGVLRRGHKLMFTGGSKAHKSFALIHLALCLASGGKWLGFQCKKGRVLYVNCEISHASFVQRVNKVAGAMPSQGIYVDRSVMENFDIISMRGHCRPLPELADVLAKKYANAGYIAIILDPLYKLFGDKMDENSNSDVARLCNYFDQIAEETGASVVFAHHHSKGAQGGKRAIDRGAGAGSFARDADAMVDMLELEGMAADGTIEDVDGYEFAFTLREFAPIQPIRAVWKYPLYHADTEGLTATMNPAGSTAGARSKANGEEWTAKERRFKAVYEGLFDFEQAPTVTDLSRALCASDRTVKAQAERFGFVVVDGRVYDADHAPQLQTATDKRLCKLVQAYDAADEKTVPALAVLMGVSPDTVRRYIRDTVGFSVDRKGNIARSME